MTASTPSVRRSKRKAGPARESSSATDSPGTTSARPVRASKAVRPAPDTNASSERKEIQREAIEVDGGGEEELAPKVKKRAKIAVEKRPAKRKSDRSVEAAERFDLEGEEEEQMEEDGGGGEEEEVEEETVCQFVKKSVGNGREKAQPAGKSRKNANGKDPVCRFVGKPIPEDKARQRWPDRYQKGSGKRSCGSALPKNGGKDEEAMKVKCHYLKAQVDDCIYNLNDDAYVKAGDGEPDYIGRIVEFFETTDRKLYFTAQWFFRVEDTVIKEHASTHDERRVFLSEEKNDNVLDCIVSKIKIVRVAPNIDLEAKEKTIPSCDLYYDMSYDLAYTTFANLPAVNSHAGSETSSTISSEEGVSLSKDKSQSDSETSSLGHKTVITLLDLYSGCGAMSTGLCLGANLSGLNLETRWAVDFNPHACGSLKLNHPQTEVRNEKAEDFLALLREWENLCRKFSLLGTENFRTRGMESHKEDGAEPEDFSEVPRGEFEVGKIVGICYGDPNNIGKVGVKFKVRWKGYGPSEDTWEPIDGLSKCQECIEDFVRRGYKSGILPLPGDVDVICGGPPCQGISGFNRFRNYQAPLEDPKNRQMPIFMDIVEFLKPKYVLMENVVDILKFAGGFLGRYAISRLVSMNYQTKLGMMAAGCYGLPQFRMRAFLWGARPTESLPQFPLPTHNVVVRGGIPNEFEQNMVAYDENQPRDLEKALLLGDAISDLPPVTNEECRDEMPYVRAPRTNFQRYIRATKSEMVGSTNNMQNSSQKAKLFDHRPLQLNQDDYQRVCQIPKKKGANFRDLPGVRVGANNIVEWDTAVERVLLPSGKPLVPDYAMSFIKGKSAKPFGRLWWDETVPTVVTRAEPHNQVVLHPEQDRVLSIRENARLQGFPDFYKLCGPIKQRYIQVGNAVAVPVARALGYALGLAFHGVCNDQPLLTLPCKFPQLERLSSVAAMETDDDIVE